MFTPWNAKLIPLGRFLQILMHQELSTYLRKKSLNLGVSLLENDKVDIGKKRAEQLAHAFKAHPAIFFVF